VNRTASLRAILDADIIYSRVLHELMGRVADDLRKLDLVWSDQLLAEATRVLVERKGLAEAVAKRWVDYLPAAFPAGRTDIEEALASAESAYSKISPTACSTCLCCRRARGQADVPSRS
jgi:hypothetical protein